MSSAPLIRAYHRGSRPGSWFAQSGSGGGWGSGAALGAKLAAPERDVVLVSGDGFYGFGVPAAALWSAQQERAPYLAVVLVNRRYSTGTRAADALYPDGYTVQAGYPGGVFDPPPDFAAEARAAGAFGERVEDPAEVGCRAAPRSGCDPRRHACRRGGRSSVSARMAEEHAICPSDDVREADGVLATVAGVEVGVFRVHGKLVAYENRCRHQGGPVCTGAVMGKLEAVLGPGGTIVEERFSEDELHLVCPWHGWEYDLATGECAADRRIRLRAFDVREEDGQVYVTV